MPIPNKLPSSTPLTNASDDPRIQEGLRQILQLDERLMQKSVEAAMVARETFPDTWSAADKKQAEHDQKLLLASLERFQSCCDPCIACNLLEPTCRDQASVAQPDHVSSCATHGSKSCSLEPIQKIGSAAKSAQKTLGATDAAAPKQTGVAAVRLVAGYG